jgi:UDP-N-acetylglucosamine--N-acetylmuramyl-(pentapeptide) pyrophosphoryl-undecaprenol N-acetylglucosamine transferase
MNTENKHIKVIISGGGTGGHIFPALAIANEIKKRFPDTDILFVGAKGRMEMEKIPANAYPIEGLWISGINRKSLWKNFAFPFKLLSSVLKAKKIIRKFKPDFVVGTGGFASGPVLYAAQQKGIPTFIQEQNSYPGITNKLLSKKANRIYTAYDNLERFFEKEKIVKTGNPVRKELHGLTANKTEALQNFGLQSGKKTILSVGGSLGAHPLNEAVKSIVNQIKAHDYQLIWQTGKNDFDNYDKYNSDFIKVLPFISNMQDAYAAADLIISRAGAGTISELSIVGKPVILVPSPYVAEDHQTKNAQALVDKNAAIMIKENQLKSDLWNNVQNIFSDEKLADDLKRNIKQMAMPDATKLIVDDILSYVNSRK